MLVLISCCGPKTATARRAAELYTSDLFRKSVRYAEVTGASWAVLSALYGLVWPDTVIAPYDLRLQSLGRPQRVKWAHSTAEALGVPGADTRIEILAGRTYTDPLIGPLESLGWSVSLPLAGMQIGERLRWLKRHNARQTGMFTQEKR